MNGTCIETPPQKIPGEDEPFIFSFFSDISANQDVVGLVQTVQANMKNTLTTLTRYLTRWKKYRGVWKVDKVMKSSDGRAVIVMALQFNAGCRCGEVVPEGTHCGGIRRPSSVFLQDHG
jgi:DNA polymerase II small subunit/DNA polymerase delta subunit B